MGQQTYTREEIEAMQNVDVRTVDPDMLRDIRDVTVNTALPKPHRYGCDLGGKDALLHTLEVLTENFFAKHSGH